MVTGTERAGIGEQLKVARGRGSGAADGVGGTGHLAAVHPAFHSDGLDGGGGAHGDGAAVGGAAGRGRGAVSGVMDSGAAGGASDGHVLRAGVSARGRRERGRGHRLGRGAIIIAVNVHVGDVAGHRSGETFKFIILGAIPDHIVCSGKKLNGCHTCVGHAYRGLRIAVNCAGVH